MSKIKNGGLDQYGDGPFEQQQFVTAGVEGVNQTRSLGTAVMALSAISMSIIMARFGRQIDYTTQHFIPV